MKERAHSLPSFCAWLNKGFDLRAHASQMSDARSDPEISPSSVFLALFHSLEVIKLRAGEGDEVRVAIVRRATDEAQN